MGIDVLDDAANLCGLEVLIPTERPYGADDQDTKGDGAIWLFPGTEDDKATGDNEGGQRWPEDYYPENQFSHGLMVARASAKVNAVQGKYPLPTVD